VGGLYRYVIVNHGLLSLILYRVAANLWMVCYKNLRPHFGIDKLLQMLHVWDHFDYTNDVAWFKETGWPLLKVRSSPSQQKLGADNRHRV